MNQNLLSEGLNYHIKNDMPIRESVYRPGSESFFSFIIEAKRAYMQGLFEVDDYDHDLLTSDIGEYGEFNGGFVPLDYPIPVELDESVDNVDNIDEKRKRKRKKKRRPGKQPRRHICPLLAVLTPFICSSGSTSGTTLRPVGRPLCSMHCYSF